jgi:hypothetical protein
MDLEKVYYDSEGVDRNILRIVQLEPVWAAVRIQEGEKAIAVLKRILAAHEVSSVDWDAMREAEKIILSFKEK